MVTTEATFVNPVMTLTTVFEATAFVNDSPASVEIVNVPPEPDLEVPSIREVRTDGEMNLNVPLLIFTYHESMIVESPGMLGVSQSHGEALKSIP